MTTAPRSTRSVARAGVALLGVAVMMSLSACGSEPEGVITEIATGSPSPSDASEPSTSTSAAPTPSATPSRKPKITGKLLKGTRQVAIVPVPGFESAVGIDDTGKLGLTDGESAIGLFVFTPVKDAFVIRAASANGTGDPPCLKTEQSGSDPITVEAAACDATAAEQLFELEVDDPDDNGAPVYSISQVGAYLQETRDGLILKELGDSPLETTFKLADNGKSTLQPLE